MMIVKAPQPLDSLPGHSLSTTLRVYLQINQLKRLYRQGWLRRGLPEAICESVAEHVFSMAMLAMLHFDRLDPAIDRNRLLVTILIHELGEIYAGDITPADGVLPEEKHRLERQSVERVLEGLPQAAEWMQLWEDFEHGATPEARLAREFDLLEMCLQALVYGAESHLNVLEFFTSGRRVVRDAQLKGILEEAAALLGI